ncbi:IS3 family transposase [Nocardia sp. NEAU-G5]|uniref:IS3 family transposase n=1 Tax=Nocardia albiluteola TaxID=2842303 RepID=A0ABS6B9M0_9NOCA|nr:IS3 family transposase [Nocardia albiluteola]MBU3066992.1 IS3 family transposase [Nocardia albiluteola]
MQLEPIGTKTWATRQDLTNAIFEYIEAYYNPVRRRSRIAMLRPVEYERTHATAHAAA